MATKAQSGIPRQHFPGTFHYSNPDVSDTDSVLISGFGRGVRWGAVALLIYVLLISLNLVTTGVNALGFSELSRIIGTTTHPLLALILGLMLTFMVQSSTVFTTLTVATVGAGVVPVESAAMLILGANIGTCFSAQLVAFGFFRRGTDLGKAVAAAMSHWWFNVLSVLTLFPIELVFHPLTQTAGWISTAFLGSAPVNVPVADLTHHYIDPIVSLIGPAGLAGAIGSATIAALVSIAVGVSAIAVAIRLISRLMRDITAASSHVMLENSLEKSRFPTPLRTIAAGIGLTLMSRSSSATICSTLPFTGTGLLSLRREFALILGANLGTTLTAVLTALAAPGEFGNWALQVALIHVIFNLTGVLVLVLVPPLARGVLWLSQWSARLAVRAPLSTFLGLLSTYTIIPMAIIATGILK